MRKAFIILAGIVAFAFTPAAHADPPVTSMSIECNWGKLTMEMIQGGFDQGGHASDPSGDGTGPLDADQPRVGLPNLIEQGNLEATCLLIEDLLSG